MPSGPQLPSEYGRRPAVSDTPRTDALREGIIGQYKEDELTGNGMGNILSALTDIETLERERDEWAERWADLSRASVNDICAQRERDTERALADRLHGALDALDYNLAFAGNTLIGGLRERVTAMRAIALPALAAWKESRQDRNHS